MNIELTIVIPCLNEEKTLQICIDKCKQFLQQHNVVGEILVADNGSSDRSIEIANNSGVVLINVKNKGYGAALIGGMNAAKGKYIAMADADDSYNFLELFPFLEKLREGNDLVIGNRFQGVIHDNAMPILNRYIGNPILSFVGKIFFGLECSDFHCGMRSIRKDVLEQLAFSSSGMEFASEMLIKASMHKLKIAEVPINLYQDGRGKQSHLRPWRDGLRHLNIILISKPDWLFFYPGLLLAYLGIIGVLALSFSIRIHSLLFLTLATILGSQLICFSIIARNYALKRKLIANDFLPKYFAAHSYRYFIFGIILTVLGSIGLLACLFFWINKSFGDLDPISTMRIAIPSAGLFTLGIQWCFSSLLFSLFELNEVKN